MPEKLIPGEVKQFILDYIDSVAELEGLLLLCRDRQASWGAEELAERLYTTSEQSEQVLLHLNSLGFVTANGENPVKYSYSPDSENKAKMVERVGEVYSKYLVPVTNLIHSKAQTKVQQFADAFKLRNRTD